MGNLPPNASILPTSRCVIALTPRCLDAVQWIRTRPDGRTYSAHRIPISIGITAFSPSEVGLRLVFEQRGERQLQPQSWRCSMFLKPLSPPVGGPARQRHHDSALRHRHHGPCWRRPWAAFWWTAARKNTVEVRGVRPLMAAQSGLEIALYRLYPNGSWNASAKWRKRAALCCHQPPPTPVPSPDPGLINCQARLFCTTVVVSAAGTTQTGYRLRSERALRRSG